ncbi:uncharacterized protein LOC111695150 [Eurytemora carolleeae]|uniref:uncharacterized protein LOC111695150 n=1 Tax=Eurytemora carolleeae TaxID=1294199 RepID=UPI000C772CAE|nr:uncharacterized protein LOC111695150 [Eurytemora carolleeae]|eukprot:XP_023320130.1 uncharacterized protein LOC111695150 [Eurytemora affinis]
MRMSVNREILLYGVYLYTANDKDILDESIESTFDRTTTLIRIFKNEETLLAQEDVCTGEQARAEVRSPNHRPHLRYHRFNQPVRIYRDSWYDIEHSLFPTDVLNHYSGWPITRCGAELWTCYGQNGKELSQVENITFRFCRKNQRSGRDCTIEGQIPILVFWPI